MYVYKQNRGLPNPKRIRISICLVFRISVGEWRRRARAY